jgi:hypothetical protein
MMRVSTARATIERQIWSRFRTRSYWIGAALPVGLISLLIYQAGRATSNPPMTMFLAVVSALWVGGSGCVREIVDERRLIQRDPHVSLFAYAIAKMLHAALMAAAQSLILSAFVALGGVVHLPLFSIWVILFLTTMSGCLMALVLSALCDEAATALAWFPLMLVPQVVFAGFLFPYGELRPFAVDPATGQVVEMPPPLRRSPLGEGPLRLVGAVTISRWALEGYAAQVYGRNLSDEEARNEAVKVNVFLPLTLSDEPISERLIDYLSALSRGRAEPAPDLDTHAGRYLFVLLLFVGTGAAMLVAILPLRDPRRP